MVTREPEFSASEVEVLLASRRADADMGPHGIPMSEATDPAMRDQFVVDALPTTDHVKAAQKRAQDAYYKTYPDAPRDTHIWPVRRRDT